MRKTKSNGERMDHRRVCLICQNKTYHISHNLRKQSGYFHVYCRYPKRKKNEQNMSDIQRRIFDSTKIHFVVKINWLDAFLSYTSPDTFNTNRSLLFFLMFVILGNK